MQIWYEIEYSYNRPGSEKIKYKGTKVFDKQEDAEKFAAVVYWLSKKNNLKSDYKQNKISEKFLGKGKFVALKKVYKCTRKEIKIKIHD